MLVFLVMLVMLSVSYFEATSFGFTGAVSESQIFYSGGSCMSTPRLFRSHDVGASLACSPRRPFEYLNCVAVSVRVESGYSASTKTRSGTLSMLSANSSVSYKTTERSVCRIPFFMVFRFRASTRWLCQSN